MVTVDLEWAEDGPTGSELPAWLEVPFLPYPGVIINWVNSSEQDYSAEVVDVEVNVYGDAKDLCTIYVKPV